MALDRDGNAIVPGNLYVKVGEVTSVLADDFSVLDSQRERQTDTTGSGQPTATIASVDLLPFPTGGGGPHASDHENGGSDEISVAGLSGELADPQPPKTHAASHQHGGGDQIAVAAAAANAIPKAGAGGTLAKEWLPAATTTDKGAVIVGTDPTDVPRMSDHVDFEDPGNADLPLKLDGSGNVPTHAHATLQPIDALLSAIAALVTAADKLPYFTGVDTVSQTDLTSFARTLLDDANAAAARATLLLGTAAVLNEGLTGPDLVNVTNLLVLLGFYQGLGDKGAANGYAPLNASAAVPIANGGTANTTAAAGFDALAPTTTAGDLIYRNGSGNTRLAAGTQFQALRMNSAATAPQWFSDLVWVAPTADTAVNVTSDATIVTRDVTGVAAGDQVEVEAWFTILNNSGATRVYVITMDFDSLFDVEISTGACATSSTLMTQYHVTAVCDVRSTSLVYAMVEIQSALAAGVASGGDFTMAATNLQGMGWGTSSSDATGTLTVALKVRSANNTATQTLRLHHFSIRKVTPT